MIAPGHLKLRFLIVAWMHRYTSAILANNSSYAQMTIDMATRVIQHPNLTAVQAAARVSLLKGDTKQVADIFAGHVWEATGYGFTLVDSEYHVNGSIGPAGHVRTRLPRRRSDLLREPGRVVVRGAARPALCQ